MRHVSRTGQRCTKVKTQKCLFLKIINFLPLTPQTYLKALAFSHSNRNSRLYDTIIVRCYLNSRFVCVPVAYGP